MDLQEKLDTRRKERAEEERQHRAILEAELDAQREKQRVATQKQRDRAAKTVSPNATFALQIVAFLGLVVLLLPVVTAIFSGEQETDLVILLMLLGIVLICTSGVVHVWERGQAVARQEFAQEEQGNLTERQIINKEAALLVGWPTKLVVVGIALLGVAGSFFEGPDAAVIGITVSALVYAFACMMKEIIMRVRRRLKK